MKAEVLTHGCRSNLAEADALAAHFGPGWTVINSCAVTAAAVRDARAAAVKAAAAGRRVVVTGCAAEVVPERFADVAGVMGREAKAAVAGLTQSRRSRAFVSVQDGCDHRCTFCVTRLARGPSRVRPMDEVVAACTRMVAAGAPEIVLTGIDLSSWREGSMGVGGLVQAILSRVPGLGRLRLSSLDPAHVDEALIEAFAEPRLMPQLHLSLQSGDARTLKRMGRRHRPDEAVRLVERVRARRPEVAVGCDLIAGFPGEDEDAHRATMAHMAECAVATAHVFAYSERPGTAAARMPQLPAQVRRRRAAELRGCAQERKLMFLARMLWNEIDIVSEGVIGVAPNGVRVRLTEPAPSGRVIRVTPWAVRGGELWA